MSSFAIKSAAQWIGNLIAQEVQSLIHVKDNVDELLSELEWMQCFLSDADSKQNKNALIQKWVSEISDLAMESEDLIEMYILEVSYKRRDGFRNSLKWGICCWGDVKTLHILASQINYVTLKIAKLSSRLQTYGVQSSYSSHASETAITKKLLAEQRRTYAHAQPDLIVGLEKDVATLVEKLEQGSKKIIVVHGMGGIGKTALAREVYHSCLSKGHFVSCAWAYVSQQCTIAGVCKDLLYELIPKENTKERKLIDSIEASRLSSKLREILTKNKYLVVLDDVWTASTWRILEPAFPINDVSFDSKILVTTRNSQILSHLGESLVSTWEAETLKEDSRWKLLEHKGNFRRASEINDTDSRHSRYIDSAMEEVAKKMLDHCNGHPLAIVVLGGVLVTKKSLEEWESVCENLLTYLQGDEEPYSGVYDVLAMSYNDLNYHLKPCFLHVGHFPEDCRIDVEKLYNFWIADGIVSSFQDHIRKKRSLEDIANAYLNQLVQKGMIQLHDNDKLEYTTTCSLHDLMRDKCLEMTTEEHFLQIVNLNEMEENTFSDAQNERARRLTVHVGKDVVSQHVLKSLSRKMTSLRAIVFISTCTEQDRTKDGCEWVKTICKRFKLLRVLDFEGGVIIKGTLPRKVGNLIYLRYLCLKGTQITKLPSSIRKLKSLVILDLRVSRVIIKFPNVLWKMSSLCCLYFPERILQLDGHDSQGYATSDGSQLILKKAYDSHLEMVNHVDLDEVEVKGLLKLTSLRKLSATCRRHKENLKPFLVSKTIKHLDLKIDARLLTGDSKMLLSESNSLHILHIDAPPPRLGPRIYIPIQVDMFPCNLVLLGFWYCKFSEDPMPVLEKLPKLKNLELHMCYDREEIKCSEKAFPELTYIELDGLFRLKAWNVQKGGFPKLQHFEVYNCPLHKIPDALPPNIKISAPPTYKRLIEEFRQQTR